MGKTKPFAARRLRHRFKPPLAPRRAPPVIGQPVYAVRAEIIGTPGFAFVSGRLVCNFRNRNFAKYAKGIFVEIVPVIGIASHGAKIINAARKPKLKISLNNYKISCETINIVVGLMESLRFKVALVRHSTFDVRHLRFDVRVRDCSGNPFAA